jgi:hypothetical protein
MLPEKTDLYYPLRDNNIPLCLLELKMMKFSQQIREKPDWFEKINNTEITTKWKKEAEAQGLTSDAAEYVVEEAKYYATKREGCIEPGPVDGTWKADGLIDAKSLEKLEEIVKKLEDVPADKKDYHPGSDNLVVDLVHPSLYCFVEDRSILRNKETIDKELLPQDPEVPKKKIRVGWEDYDPPSSVYRWMPAEVTCGKDGEVSFDSYINNLHPKQHSYEAIASILQKFIPLFNRSLTDIVNRTRKPRLDLSRFDWYDNAQFNYEDYGSDDDYDEDYQRWEQTRPILPVPVPKFEAQAAPKKIVDLKGEKLQVIVKLANIELTPEKPKYGGGTWHVEGIDQERIVATGIYYYDMDNITESKLTFRHSVEEPGYEQNDNRGVQEVYGLINDGPLNQVLGNLTAEKGRCIVFPNIYQHYVAPFRLVDKTKPGFRKILVFFLVDPTVKVISTHNVLPQQPDWDDVEAVAPAEERKKMTREEAEEMREKLMFERKFARDVVQKEVYERVFSLCEH